MSFGFGVIRPPNQGPGNTFLSAAVKKGITVRTPSGRDKKSRKSADSATNSKQTQTSAGKDEPFDSSRRAHEIGQRIKEARLSAKPHKMSQNDLARKINLTAGAVGQWEIGNNSPSGPTLDKLAKALKRSRNWILFGQESKPARDSAVAVGQRIMSRREKLGWSRLALAVKLGVDPGTVSRWESGDTPGMSTMDTLAEVLGSSRTWLLTGTDAEKAAPQDIVEESILAEVRGKRVEEKAQILSLLEHWTSIDLDPVLALEALQRFADLTPESRQAALAMMGGLPKSPAAVKKPEADPVKGIRQRNRKREKDDASS